MVSGYADAAVSGSGGVDCSSFDEHPDTVSAAAINATPTRTTEYRLVRAVNIELFMSILVGPASATQVSWLPDRRSPPAFQPVWAVTMLLGDHSSVTVAGQPRIRTVVPYVATNSTRPGVGPGTAQPGVRHPSTPDEAPCPNGIRPKNPRRRMRAEGYRFVTVSELLDMQSS
ncbi:hypothetical protein RDE2_39370 [Rhodococcus sp. RDE2]|nr:hypothetical protein RDE2_39370 [Rhodococcus sp. RDE2]